jgi:hypothetical protein
MSRDSYSYEPQDTRDVVPGTSHRRREPESPKTRTGRGSEDAPDDDRQKREARERSVLKPERDDSPRAYYMRDRAYLLRDSEVHTLGEIGRFA